MKTAGKLFRVLLTTTLVFSAASNSNASVSEPLAVLAHGEGTSLLSGSTLFDGSVVRSFEKGRAVVVFMGGKGALHLGNNSTVRFLGTPENTFLELSKGAISFSARKDSSLVVTALGVVVRPPQSGPAGFQVQVVSSNTVAVAASRSAAYVETDKGTVEVPTGRLAIFQVSNPKDHEKTTTDKEKERKDKRRAALVLITLIAGINIVAIILNYESDDCCSTVAIPSSPVVP